MIHWGWDHWSTHVLPLTQEFYTWILYRCACYHSKILINYLFAWIRNVFSSSACNRMLNTAVHFCLLILCMWWIFCFIFFSNFFCFSSFNLHFDLNMASHRVGMCGVVDASFPVYTRFDVNVQTLCWQQKAVQINSMKLMIEE